MHNLSDIIEEKAEKDGRYAIAYALLELTFVLKQCGMAIADLGFGNSPSHPGTTEMIGMHLERLAKALEALEPPNA